MNVIMKTGFEERTKDKQPLILYEGARIVDGIFGFNHWPSTEEVLRMGDWGVNQAAEEECSSWDNRVV